MRKYFGTDGIRGKANQFPMTSDFTLKLGQAAAHLFKNTKGEKHKIVIGKDTRVSGYMFENALVSGICSMGVDAVMVGVLPTPAIALITRSIRADAGVVISASHNPYHDNGIKFFSADGYKLSDETEFQIERMIEHNSIDVSQSEIGKAYRIATAIGRYVEYSKRSFEKTADLKGLKIVLDCANGATYKVAPMAISELGADVILTHVEPNGTNINDGCGAVYPERLAKTVLEYGADVGISFDGDGDRVIFVDEKGNVVDGDFIMGICGRFMNSRQELNQSTIVATVMSNLGFERSVNAQGIQLVRSDVGDRAVLADMRKGGYNLGGEQSGHMIFSDYNTTGDGLISAFQLLKVMVLENKPLSELRQFIELYPQVLKNAMVTKKIPLDQLAETSNLIQSVEQKLGSSGRILVRYSGTEPKIRVMLEGEDQKVITDYADEIAAAAVKEIDLMCRG